LNPKDPLINIQLDMLSIIKHTIQHYTNDDISNVIYRLYTSIQKASLTDINKMINFHSIVLYDHDIIDMCYRYAVYRYHISDIRISYIKHLKYEGLCREPCEICGYEIKTEYVLMRYDSIWNTMSMIYECCLECFLRVFGYIPSFRSMTRVIHDYIHL
jgi:hypothetical protein